MPDDADGDPRGIRYREIRYGAVLPVEPDRAFGFVSDPGNWPEFFPGIRSTDASPGWGRPGGRGRMVTSFLGRAVASDLEVTEWDPPRAFRYVARHHGRPDLDNHRVFEPAGPGTRLVGTTRIPVRPGPRGLVDRVSLRVLRRMYGRAMDRLPDVLGRP
jgi:hypothetical protein